MNGRDAIIASRWFDLSEFNDCPNVELIDPGLIMAADAWRSAWGRPIHPGRDAGAFVRLSGSRTSRHYAVGRWSDAGDFFPEGDVREAWLLAQTFSEFGGFGFYTDTNRNPLQPGPMIHLDLRPGPRAYWAREKGTYYGQNKAPNDFWRVIASGDK